MARNYEQHLENRLVDIDGIDDWAWIKSDNGAWDGPKGDWNNGGKVRYLEHVKKFDVCVQAGGNCGMYPRLFAKHFDRVFTFEPDPLNFFTLVINCQEDNIVKMQAALGDVHGMVQVNRHTMQNVGMHQVSITPQAYIPQLRIDDLVLPHCDLIQLDIEQYEIYALNGARETINKFRPVVVVENNNDNIRDFFKEHRYEVASTTHMDTIYRPL